MTVAERERQERVKSRFPQTDICQFCRTAVPDGDKACANRKTAIGCSWLRGSERDRLLQSSGGDSWKDEGKSSEEIVTEAVEAFRADLASVLPTPAEPNPPGSGEPVAWRTAVSICRSFANWNYERIKDEADTVFAPAANAANDCADLIERYARDGNLDGTNLEGLALYAAPLPSPGDQARIKELEAENARQDEQITSLQFQMNRERNICHAERQRREEAEALVLPMSEAWASYRNTERNRLDAMRARLGASHFSDAAKHFANYAPRTRATATGGGDNG